MGRHEVARSNLASFKTLFAAGGAGLITAGTVVLKISILHRAFGPWMVGLLATLDFVVSFLLMQALGFRLATKLAPLFGSALAYQWKKFERIKNTRFNQEFWLSFKTQLISALGNFIFVVPAAVVFHFLYKTLTGAGFLDPPAATAILASFNPWKTGTLLYAALTGVLLWFCTFLGGWVGHRFKPLSKTMTTVFFNVFLGALLAFIPVLGKALGIPLDVRHFTLTGGAIVIATSSLGIHGALHSGLGTAFLGFFLIGVLNFSVSFILAFLVSLR